MAKDDYVYAVTRVHSSEKALLSRQDLEQLIAAENVDEAFRMLADKGWGTQDAPENDADALVAAETRKTWQLIGELTGDVAPFNVFRYGNDYHNLKAAIKLAYTHSGDKDQNERFYLSEGTVELDKIIKAAGEHSFSGLPDEMAKAGREAYEALQHTGNGQTADMIIDRAALIAIYEAGKKSGSELLRRYAELKVDSANIKAAVRCCVMNRSREFTERAIAPVGTLNIHKLLNAAMESLEAIYDLLERTNYSGGVGALKTSLAAFERWCDDQVMDLVRPQRHEYFGIEPLAAFILGRENEIAMVRLILSAKINNLSTDALRERLRETYV